MGCLANQTHVIVIGRPSARRTDRSAGARSVDIELEWPIPWALAPVRITVIRRDLLESELPIGPTHSAPSIVPFSKRWMDVAWRDLLNHSELHEAVPAKPRARMASAQPVRASAWKPMEAELRENAIAVPRQATRRAVRALNAALSNRRGIFSGERRRRIVGAVGGQGNAKSPGRRSHNDFQGSLSRAPLGRKPDRTKLVPFREPVTLL